MISEEWYNEYCRYVLNENIKMNEIIKMTATHFPQHLYRYSSFDNFGSKDKWKNEIFDHKVRLSDPRYFNDPFDCEVCVDSLELNGSSAVKMSIISQLKRLFKLSKVDESRILYSENAVEAMCTVLNHHGRSTKDVNIEKAKHIASESNRNKFKMLCFSEKLTSILMWSHYAKNHKGYCLEYKLDQDMADRIYPVVYSQQRPLLSAEGIDGKENMWMFKQIVCKSSQWSYEEEWRLISKRISLENSITHVSEFSEINVDFGDSIIAVYLGNKVSIDNEREILGKCKEQGVSVYKMQLHPTEYKLVPNQLI